MKLSLIDLDSMLYTVAYRQWKSGNRQDKTKVANHVKRFVGNIDKSSGGTHVLRFFQDIGHTNFRKELLPQYKGHRTPDDFVTHWKPTIVETFRSLDAIALTNIESDDAISIIADKIGWDKIIVVSSDKDMKQVAGDHYNPFKKGKAGDPSRWFSVSVDQANQQMWRQAITGDSTDMPNEYCGIFGTGDGTVNKRFAKEPMKPYGALFQEMYIEKYGEEEGFKRAKITYQMSRLLKVKDNDYLPLGAKTEVSLLLQIYKPLIKEVKNDIKSLFTPSTNEDVVNLFK